MKKYRIIYSFILLLSWIFVLAYKSVFSVVLMFTAIIAPVISLILFAASFFLIKFEMTEDEIVCAKKQPFTVTLIIKNYFIIPTAAMRITGVMQDDDGIARNGQIFVSMPALKKVPLLYKGSLFYRGEYYIGADYTEMTDIFHLFRLRKKINKKTRVIVLPEQYDLAYDSKLSSENDLSSDVQKFSGDKSNIFSSVREYRSGDPLKLVHWKLTSKHDDVIVRNTESLNDYSRLIICDTGEYFISESENMSAVDRTLELALAAAKNGIENNYKIDIAAAGRIYHVNNGNYDGLYREFALIERGGELQLENTDRSFSDEAEKYDSVYLISPHYSRDVVTAYSDMPYREKVFILTGAFKAYDEEEALFCTENNIRLCLFENDRITEMFGI